MRDLGGDIHVERLPRHVPAPLLVQHTRERGVGEHGVLHRHVGADPTEVGDIHPATETLDRVPTPHPRLGLEKVVEVRQDGPPPRRDVSLPDLRGDQGDEIRRNGPVQREVPHKEHGVVVEGLRGGGGAPAGSPHPLELLRLLTLAHLQLFGVGEGADLRLARHKHPERGEGEAGGEGFQHGGDAAVLADLFAVRGAQGAVEGADPRGGVTL